jgi:hypothetical protein
MLAALAPDGLVPSLLLGNGIGGRLVRRIPPLLLPQCSATSQDDAPDRAVVAPRRCWAARRGAAPKRRRKGCPARVPGPALAGGCPLIEAPG